MKVRQRRTFTVLDDVRIFLTTFLAPVLLLY